MICGGGGESGDVGGRGRRLIFVYWILLIWNSFRSYN